MLSAGGDSGALAGPALRGGMRICDLCRISDANLLNKEIITF